jgi:hypothetical protein
LATHETNWEQQHSARHVPQGLGKPVVESVVMDEHEGLTAPHDPPLPPEPPAPPLPVVLAPQFPVQSG